MNLLSARLAELVGDLQVLRGQFQIALAAAVRETACRATGDVIDRLWPKLANRNPYPLQRHYPDDPWREEEEEANWKQESTFRGGVAVADMMPGNRKTPFYVLLLLGLLTSAVAVVLRPPIKTPELFDLFLSLRAATLD
jgi:hypothetical protein